MVRVEREVLIERPAGEVFAFISDPGNDALWNSSIVETARLSEGPLGVGAQLRSTMKFLGQHADAVFEVVEYEAGRKLCVRAISGPIQSTGCRIVEAVGDGCRVTQWIEGEGGFFRVAGSLIRSVLGRQLEADLATLKRLLET